MANPAPGPRARSEAQESARAAFASEDSRGGEPGHCASRMARASVDAMLRLWRGGGPA